MPYIYKLNCPLCKQPKYVGRTVDPDLRLRGHYCKQNNPMMQTWITKLKKLGLRPTIKIIEEASFENADKREQYWILKLNKKYKLLNINHTNGINLNHKKRKNGADDEKEWGLFLRINGISRNTLSKYYNEKYGENKNASNMDSALRARVGNELYKKIDVLLTEISQSITPKTLVK